ncbi:MAG: hypothetical protein C0592_08340 [Marinilabiliales bacterium]|nr:MAG: hypothetical protein C0592_08340 [Marinilabiliales bacterium]
MTKNKRLAKKVLLIGWDAADWKIINPLMDAGKMPALEKLVNNGVIGNLATLDPPLSPVLWTSIATGKRADKHGIIGFVEPDPDVGGVRPVNVTSRKSKAIWNILQHEGLKSSIYSWWPSHPVEPISGIMVSNYYQKCDSPEVKGWFMPDGTVQPEELRKDFFKLRVHVKELTGDILHPFIPNLNNIDQEKDRRIVPLAKILSETVTTHAAATHGLRKYDWDFGAVYFDGIDHTCHGYMKFSPPKLDSVDDEDYENYKNVVEGMYIFHDMMLDRYMEIAGEDTIFVLISDHGFNSDYMRLAEMPKCNTAPAFDHSPFGIICISGPGIKKDERVYGSTLLDITPTILAMFGLPVGDDMDGKVLANIFEEEMIRESIPSWEDVEGECGMHSPDKLVDTHESAEALRQLVELGYIEDPGEDSAAAAERSIREGKYNLAKIKNARRNYEEALIDFEELYHEDSDDMRFNLELIRSYLHFKRFEDARKVIDNFKKTRDAHIVEIDFLDGIVSFNEGDTPKALEIFERLLKTTQNQPGINLQVGMIFMQADDYDKAIELFRKELEIDDNNSLAYYNLGVANLKMRKFQNAADAFLSCIGLTYSMPAAHYFLAVSLYLSDFKKEAANAFNIFLTMAPANMNARIFLSRIYQEMGDPKFKSLNEQVMNMKKGEVVVVSGLPRSGTSMMMQMLDAGGLEIMTDNTRQADDNNPKGYYEYEPVKSLARDSSWMPEADGKVIKVIAQLLKHLPDGFTYKVIFMERDLNEVLTSQQKMLGKDPKSFPMAIAETFKKDLVRIDNWFEMQPNIEVMKVSYSDIIASPEEYVEKIVSFLPECELDAGKMLTAIDPELYRNKA